MDRTRCAWTAAWGIPEGHLAGFHPADPRDAFGANAFVDDSVILDNVIVDYPAPVKHRPVLVRRNAMPPDFPIM